MNSINLRPYQPSHPTPRPKPRCSNGSRHGLTLVHFPAQPEHHSSWDHLCVCVVSVTKWDPASHLLHHQKVELEPGNWTSARPCTSGLNLLIKQADNSELQVLSTLLQKALESAADPDPALQELNTRPFSPCLLLFSLVDTILATGNGDFGGAERKCTN